MEQSIKQLFIDFIANRCNIEKTNKVLKLIRKGGFEEEWEQAMRYAEQNFYTDENSITIDENKIYEKIRAKAKLTHRFNKSLWVSVAASIILISSISIFYYKSSSGEKSKILNPVVQSVGKPVDNRKWIKLPDGTSVQLNSNSTLDYPESFDHKKTREVFLIGEAYFDVKHDAKHPFIIHTGKIRTTVLGTAFNISAYKANKNVTVTVSRGKVMVQDDEKTLAVLTTDQQLSWVANSKTANKLKVNVETVLAWKAQDLIMDDITLAEASEMIAHRYAVKINFKNERVKNCKFTAAFLNRNEISQVLNVLSDITGAKLELKNGVINIDGSGC